MTLNLSGKKSSFRYGLNVILLDSLLKSMTLFLQMQKLKQFSLHDLAFVNQQNYYEFCKLKKNINELK